MYRELANNYVALQYNAKTHCDFDWLRNNLTHELAFDAYKKAATNPEAFYYIPEQGWLERSFKELQKCTTLPLDDEDLVEQLTRTCSTIEGVAPPADAQMFRSMLPNVYAGEHQFERLLASHRTWRRRFHQREADRLFSRRANLLAPPIE